VVIFTVAASVLWLGLILLAPYLKSQNSPWAAWLYRVFAPTCHQIDSRCFFLFGYPLAVCARCLGIYLGFLAGTIAEPWVRSPNSALPGLRTFLVFTLPIGLDTLGNMLGIWHTPSVVRLTLGLGWGVLLPRYWVTGLTEALLRVRPTFRLKSEG
jgi:uncharacterized membrane protein